jgi:GTP-binding protein Era
VFSDTPGILKPAYNLHKRMMKAVDSSLLDADVAMFVVEVNEKGLTEEVALRLKNLTIPLIVVINKVDVSTQEHLEERVAYWKGELNPTAIIPVSALEAFNVDAVKNTILQYIPEAPPYFNKEDLSDRNVRFFVTEIIRETLLMQYQKEVPYSCEVAITEYKEDTEIDRIRCEIYVDRESQKAILLGHKGAAIKKLGTESRRKIEKFISKHIFIDITIKVREDWRNDERQLDKFGYKED